VREQVAIDRCPSIGDLVAAADGGLSLTHKTAVTAHLRRCFKCRDLLRQANAFREANAEVIEGEHATDTATASATVLSKRRVGELDAVAASFEDEVGARFDSAAKTEARNREFAQRLHKQKQDVIHRQPANGGIRQWLPAAALIPLLIVGLAFSRMNTVVRAEELLSRASRYESSVPGDRVQRLRIRFTPGIPAFAPLVAGGTRSAAPRVGAFLAVRDVTGGSVRDAGLDGVDVSGEYAALAETLARHGFEWRQPLGLDGLRAWRASVGQLRDEVFATGDMLVLKTTTPEGALREVDLTVRRHDFHVVRLTLAFEGIGRLEIAEIEESVQRAVKAAPLAPIATTAAAPVAMTTVPAPVARGVAVDSALSPVTTVVGRMPVSQPGLSRWLDRTFGARPERKTFVPDLQRLVIGVRQNLSALDTLAKRYPEEEVQQQWSGADRVALRRRVDESYRRISRDLNDLDARVGILFGSTTRSLPIAEAPADWRQRAAAALAHAEAMDAQVRQLLASEDVPAASSGETRVKGGALVPSTFAALWDVVHAPVGGPASR
jgi:hypothetical protein